MTDAFKPSQVVLASIPLVGTLGHAELEYAAALIVRTCQVHGDVWAAHPWTTIGPTLKADRDAGTEPMASLLRNPFFCPDVHLLVEEGFARWTAEPGSGPVELTPLALGSFGRWVQR